VKKLNGTKQNDCWQNCAMHQKVGEIPPRGRFHQHFTGSSYNARRSRKCKKYIHAISLFALLGSARIKALRKHVDEIDHRPPGLLYNGLLVSSLLRLDQNELSFSIFGSFSISLFC